MRQQKIKLTIDNPCTQKWADFEDRGARGYCSSCQKEVIDFTRMSDGEIRTYFKNLPKGVCGQFRQDQLKVYADPTPNVALSKWLSWPLAASALLFSGVEVSAQEKDRKVQVDAKNNDQTVQRTSTSRFVSGKVTDENGEGLPGANVVIKGMTHGVTTDIDGNYRIEIGVFKTTLVFSTIGMQVVEIEAVRGDQIDVVLKSDTVILGGISYCRIYKWYTPRGLFHRVRGFFGRLF